MNKEIKILIVDDESQLLMLLSRIISLEGYEVLQAKDLCSARKQITRNSPDIILCDVFLPDGNGVDALPELKKMAPKAEIIMLTAHGNIADGVRAIKMGAYDYLTKGDDNNRIIPMIQEAEEEILQKRQSKKIQSTISKQFTFDSIIGISKPLTLVIDLAKKVAPTDAAVLLTGETGTGKEVFAQAIHAASPRNTQNFVAVNCGALSPELLESELFGYRAGAFTGAVKDKKGLFEQADSGTIFLDEIGEMHKDLQVKLLRVLETGEFIAVGDTQSKHVNVRLIAATNKDLKEAIAKHTFREDLYYRLSTFCLPLPPLRQRGKDILLIAKQFMQAFATKMNKKVDGMSDTFEHRLMNCAWKGNIRELRNVMERSVIVASNNLLDVADLPIDMQMQEGTERDELSLSAVEKRHIAKVLQYTGGNKTESARLMGIGLTTLYRKMEEYDIHP